MMLRYAWVYALNITLGKADVEAYQKVLLPLFGAVGAPVPRAPQHPANAAFAWVTKKGEKLLGLWRPHRTGCLFKSLLNVQPSAEYKIERGFHAIARCSRKAGTSHANDV